MLHSLFQNAIGQSGDVACDSVTSIMLSPTRLEQVLIIVGNVIATMDCRHGGCFVDGLEHMIILWTSATIVSSATGLLVPDESAVAPVVPTIGEASSVNDIAQDLDGTTEANTGKPLELAQDRRSLDPTSKGFFILALLFVVEFDARLELLDDQGT